MCSCVSYYCKMLPSCIIHTIYSCKATPLELLQMSRLNSVLNITAVFIAYTGLCIRVCGVANANIRIPVTKYNCVCCSQARPLPSCYVSTMPCRCTKTDLFISDLAVKWPGVRHMLALDQAQAATYVVSLTCALAMQPYKAQVLRCML